MCAVRRRGLQCTSGPARRLGTRSPSARLRAGMGGGAGGCTMSAVSSPVRAYDFLLKFLLVGDSDVGKGEILASLQDGAAESPYAYSNGAARGGAGGPSLHGPRATLWAWGSRQGEGGTGQAPSSHSRQGRLRWRWVCRDGGWGRHRAPQPAAVWRRRRTGRPPTHTHGSRGRREERGPWEAEARWAGGGLGPQDPSPPGPLRELPLQMGPGEHSVGCRAPSVKGGLAGPRRLRGGRGPPQLPSEAPAPCPGPHPLVLRVPRPRRETAARSPAGPRLPFLGHMGAASQRSQLLLQEMGPCAYTLSGPVSPVWPLLCHSCCLLV